MTIIVRLFISSIGSFKRSFQSFWSIFIEFDRFISSAPSVISCQQVCRVSLSCWLSVILFFRSWFSPNASQTTKQGSLMFSRTLPMWCELQVVVMRALENMRRCSWSQPPCLLKRATRLFGGSEDVFKGTHNNYLQFTTPSVLLKTPLSHQKRQQKEEVDKAINWLEIKIFMIWWMQFY